MNKSDLTKDQKRFIDWFQGQDSRLLKLTGYAGSGKTSVLNFLGWNGTTYYCALSNQAKNVLEGKIKSKRIYTIASLLGYLPVAEKGKIIFKKAKRDKIDCNDPPLLVVDEASMIDEKYLNDIIRTRASKILFVGDPFQIPPINYTKSPIYGDEYADVPTFHLTEIVRQANDSPILKLANSVRRGEDEWDIPEIKEIILNKTNVAKFYSESNEISVAICPTHAVKNFCNIIARKVNNGGVDPVDPYVKGELLQLESPILPDGPVNGDIVKITSIPKNITYDGFDLVDMTVNEKYNIKIPYDITVTKKIKDRYQHLEYLFSKAVTNQAKDDINNEVEELSNNITFASLSFAMTIHKAQGSSIPRILVCTEGLHHFDEKIVNRMIYTAVTRASKELVVGHAM